MKLKALLISVLVAAGVITAVALGHEVTPGSATFTCTGAGMSFDSFPNVNGNTVTITVTRDGATIYSAPFVFNGTSGLWQGSLDLSGNHIIDLSAHWTADGGGSFDTGPIPTTQFCSTVTTTVTQPTTITTTLPGTTVTTPAATVTLPATTVTTPAKTVTTPGSTVTTPGQTVTVTNNVTSPGATVTTPGPTVTVAGATTTVAGQTKTVTVKLTPKTLVRRIIRTRVKHVKVFVTRIRTVTTPARTVTVTRTVKVPMLRPDRYPCQAGFKLYQGHCVLNDGNG